MNSSETINKVKAYYTGKIKAYGPVYKGVDWNSRESQELRFEQLLKVCDVTNPFTINDYGCGYGMLVKYMTSRGYRFKYHGFDISEEMIARSKEFCCSVGNCEFFDKESCLNPEDYTVASGVFNVKLNTPDKKWLEYILETVGRINKLSKKGFSFNILTRYADKDQMRADLYYGDPCYFFDYCKRNFSENVALLHDYGFYEFTILVRKLI